MKSNTRSRCLLSMVHTLKKMSPSVVYHYHNVIESIESTENVESIENVENVKSIENVESIERNQ